MRKIDNSPIKRAARCESLRRCLIASSLVLMLIGTVFAVDPLPSYIEESPLPVREAYIERVGRESLREKIEVGRERYAERIERKKALIQAVRNRAKARERSLEQVRRHLNGETLGQAAAPVVQGGRRWTGAVWLIGLGAFVMLTLHRVMSGRWHFD